MEDVNTLNKLSVTSVMGEELIGFSMLLDDARKSEGQVALQSGLPMTLVDGSPVLPQLTAAARISLAVKRFVDLLLASLAIVALLPLFAAVGAAIVMESRGPVFFRQKREGLNGSFFWAFKFRSMRVEECDASGIAFTKAGDTRITRVGAFLRRTSIDELPQLINVVMGHMSLVGPRPHVPGMLAGGRPYRDLVSYYDSRLAMLPGITGWAQANGLRGDASDARLAKARVDHDLAYIQNYSLLLDVKIILLTLRREFLGGSGQ